MPETLSLCVSLASIKCSFCQITDEKSQYSTCERHFYFCGTWNKNKKQTILLYQRHSSHQTSPLFWNKQLSWADLTGHHLFYSAILHEPCRGQCILNVKRDTLWCCQVAHRIKWYKKMHTSAQMIQHSDEAMWRANKVCVYLTRITPAYLSEAISSMVLKRHWTVGRQFLYL